MLIAVCVQAVAVLTLAGVVFALRRKIASETDPRPYILLSFADLSMQLELLEAIDAEDRDQVRESAEFRLSLIAELLSARLETPPTRRGAYAEIFEQGLARLAPLTLLGQLLDRSRRSDCPVESSAVEAALHHARAFLPS